jgi:energy-coupling factor transporter ATP-binding protein EcfA2
MAGQTEPTPPPSANQPGDMNLAAGGDITTGGDIVGRDKLTINVGVTPSAAVKYATRADYLAQIIDRHQDLEFVGIPELKDRQALRIEDVFIYLQAEVEIGWDDIIQKTIETPPSAPITSEQALAWAITGPVLEHVAKHYSPEKVKRRVSANDALREHQRIVILGDPGAGKTTLLKYITVAFAQKQSGKLGLNEDRLPIFVRLYDYVAKKAERREDFSLVRYLYTQAEEHLLLKLEPGFFESELERGNCCVCLDGLDELGGAGLRREVSNAVAALANRYPRNRFIITSRIVGYEEAPLDRREFAHHTILSLTDDDIREFVKKWYTAREKNPASARERAEHLTKTIMSEPRIKSLAANPLMLTIIALVHRIEAELPHERVKLYDKCVTALVETWEKVKGFTVEDRERPYYKYRRRLLEQLAFWMHSQSRTTGRAREVKEGDLELQLIRFLLDNPKLQLDDESARQEAQAFIALAKSRTGLLIEWGEGVYTFTHLTFQEYLAACDIEHRLAHSIDAIWDEIKPRLHDSHWREVILLLLGSLNKFERHSTELIRRIYENTDEYENVLHWHLFLAARTIADRIEVDAALHNKIVDELLKIVRSDWMARGDALGALGNLQNDKRVRDGLLNLAHDKEADHQVRLAVAQTLEQLGQSDEAIILLLNLARNRQAYDWIRRDATVALGQIGQASQVLLSGLLDLAHDDQVSVEVRWRAARTLGQLGHANIEVASGLLNLARDIQIHRWIRSTAAEALGQSSQAGEAILSGLLDLAQNEQTDEYVRIAAAQALGRLGRIDQATVLLIDLVQNKQISAGARCRAAESVGKLGRTEEAATLLLDLAYGKQVYDLGRVDAIVALGQLGHGSDAVISGLLTLTYNEQFSSSVRGAAAEALGQLGLASNEVLSNLFNLARDEHIQTGIRYSAARALGQLGWVEEAGAILLDLALDMQVWVGVRSKAVRTLGRLGWVNDVVLSGLLDLACDKELEGGVRQRAALALGQLGQAIDIVLSSLLNIARDEAEPSDVRFAAYNSLKALLVACSAITARN